MRSCSTSCLFRQSNPMRHQQPQDNALRRFRRLTRGRASQKELQRQPLLQSCNFQRGALPMTMTTNLCALHFRAESASSRGQLGNVVQEVSIDATRRGVTVQSHIIFAPTLTDKCAMQRFHSFHLLYSLNFLRVRELFRKQRCKQGCEWLASTTKWSSRLHQWSFWTLHRIVVPAFCGTSWRHQA